MGGDLIPSPSGRGLGRGDKKMSTSNLLNKAKKLRTNQTESERRLWYYLRGWRLNGFKFRRQVVIKSYIVDFVCFEKMIIIELDGGQHANQKVYDEKRKRDLESLGFKVIRFWNNQIICHMDIVLEEIYKACC